MPMESKGLALEGGERVSTTASLQRQGYRTLFGPGLVGGATKRALDIVIAATGLVMLAPLFVLTALAVLLSSPGPLLYGHRRIGANGRVFRCWKFRSMVENSGEILERHLAENPEARAEWRRSRKLKNDVRVTPVGHILRDYSLDELPQLFNVLRGEMSIVGPRPVQFDELEMYGTDVAFYLRARPGITGLWQVSGRNDVSYDQRVSMDKAYVSQWSLLGDFVIILKTVPAALTAKGAY
ncbi:MAG: sugar transferase [Paracoccaceae bacterium]